MAAGETEIVEAVRDARERRRTLEIVGQGTKRGLGRPSVCDAVLDVSAIAGVVSYEPEELLLTARPGTPVVEIDALLAANHQRLGFEPPCEGTIGGAIAADASGPAAVRYGRARDHLLGYRAVNGFGEAYKAGGKVVKNVTGFDLPKLMCGAMGTLGPLTEVTLRVFPKPALSQIFAARLEPEAGLALLRRVWSSPLEATGLVYAGGTAFVRLEGARAPLAEKAAMLRAMADVAETGDPLPAPPPDGWRVTLPPSNAAALVAGAAHWHADWAGGLVRMDGGEDLPVAAARLGGHAMPARGAAFPAEPPARAALTRAVKAAFDPLGLFNPGRMGV